MSTNTRSAPLARAAAAGVEHHGGGVGALLVPDDVRPGPLGPDLELLRPRRRGKVSPAHSSTFFPSRTKRAAILPMVVVLPTPFTPTMRDDAGLGIQAQRPVPHLQAGGEDVRQGGAYLFSTPEALVMDTPAELLYHSDGGLPAHIRQDQRLLQVLEEFLVFPGELRKHAVERRGHVLLGAGQARLDFIEKTHGVYKASSGGDGLFRFLQVHGDDSGDALFLHGHAV